MSELPIDSPENLANWIMPWPSFNVDWSQAGVMVIDYQNYSSNPECGLTEMLRERNPEVAEYYVPRLRATIANTPMGPEP